MQGTGSLPKHAGFKSRVENKKYYYSLRLSAMLERHEKILVLGPLNNIRVDSKDHITFSFL